MASAPDISTNARVVCFVDGLLFRFLIKCLLWRISAEGPSTDMVACAKEGNIGKGFSPHSSPLVGVCVGGWAGLLPPTPSRITPLSSCAYTKSTREGLKFYSIDLNDAAYWLY